MRSEQSNAEPSDRLLGTILSVQELLKDATPQEKEGVAPYLNTLLQQAAGYGLEGTALATKLETYKQEKEVAAEKDKEEPVQLTTQEILARSRVMDPAASDNYGRGDPAAKTALTVIKSVAATFARTILRAGVKTVPALASIVVKFFKAVSSALSKENNPELQAGAKRLEESARTLANSREIRQADQQRRR